MIKLIGSICLVFKTDGCIPVVNSTFERGINEIGQKRRTLGDEYPPVGFVSRDTGSCDRAVSRGHHGRSRAQVPSSDGRNERGHGS